MKSLEQIKADNRLTNRDFGGMCDFAVFHQGDLVALFVHKEDAETFKNNQEYDDGCELQIVEAKP